MAARMKVLGKSIYHADNERAWVSKEGEGCTYAVKASKPDISVFIGTVNLA